MYRTAKDLRLIKFPVFALPEDSWYIQDKVLFLDGKVLDDTNMPGETLGIRRIQCGRKDLFRLRKGYLNLKSMLLSKKKHFIDSNGTPFTYVKTQNGKLKYHKVDEIILRETYCNVKLNNITQRFTILRPPMEEARWARVLYYGPHPWILYDFKKEQGKDSFRRV